jgi:hypothetical protein
MWTSFINWFKSLFTSTSTNAITQAVAEALGGATSVAIIELVDKDNKSGTAKDINSIGEAVLSLLAGGVPTSDQISAVMANLKSNSSTTDYALLGQKFLTLFTAQLTAWKSAGYTSTAIIQYANWYITGMQLTASAYIS